MTKVFKILGRILGISLEWVLIIITVFAFIIRTSTVQTYLAQAATDYLSSELNTTIRVDKVSIVFLDRVALDGVFALDQENDTLASIKTMYVSLKELNFKKKFIKLDEAELEGGIIHVNRAKETGEYNYQFIINYFATEKIKRGEKPFDVTLDKIRLSDVHVKYNDKRKDYSTYGVDFDHLDLQHVSLSISNFSSKDGILKAEIKDLKAKEKSGFQLDKLSAKVTASENGLMFKNLNIQTPYSKIISPKLNLIMNDLEDLQTFEDSVEFDGFLSPSAVSLKDISYFASELEGMDQMVALSGKVTRTVRNLKITDLHLKTGKETVLKGTFNLPDFREIEKSFFHESITYAYISLDDLKKIKMPVSSKQKYLSFDKYLERLAYFQIKDLRMDGFYEQFVIKSDYFRTNLGTFYVDNGIMFTENKENDSYEFKKSAASEYDVKIEKFQLNKFLDDKNFGLVDGIFFLEGEAFSLNDIRFTLIEGNVNRFDYLDYSYEDIFIEKGTFIDQKFEGKIEVKDDNLNLVYDGFIDFKDNQHMVFTVNLKKAILDNLNITTSDSTSFESKFTVNIQGKTANSMYGSIAMDGIVYKEGKQEIRIERLTVDVIRGKIEDQFDIKSDLADINLVGKINFNTLISDFTNQFSKVFPSVIKTETKTRKPTAPSNFTYSVDTKSDLNNFLSIFAPDLKIAPETKMNGTYDGKTEKFSMILSSPEIDYKEYRFIEVNMVQNLTNDAIDADYKVKHFVYSDSVELDQVHFTTNGQQNILHSILSWNQNGTNNSLISWETDLIDKSTVNFTLSPSYFSVNEQRWEIENESSVLIAVNQIQIEKFKIQRNKQYISIDGLISRNDNDKLNFRLNDIELKDIGELIGSDVQMDGVINGWGYISNPYENLLYIGDASIQNLHLNKQEIGDVYVQSEWNKGSESVNLMGNLMYRNNQTFKFDGDYFIYREKDNLDFNLVFDHTDIKFTNAFMDPDVVNNIRGLIDGKLKVTGSLESPNVKGKVELKGGNAKVEMLGVNFGFDGEIKADEYGFYIDYMPVTDEEGNSGTVIGSVYHNKYADWNFDLQFDLENNLTSRESPLFSFSPFTSTDKFLVMNTKYKEGDYYYGKAYVSGTANIFGYADNLEITVDLATKKGTTINFPMYGVSELEEEDNFLKFKPKPGQEVEEEPKIDFTGVDLNLNFRITPDAKLKIIFNEQLGDEITATGSGNISMKLDNLGDLSIDGTYMIKEGMYNFAMGPIKQPFHIEERGTITWTGDPYNATLDLRTFYEVNANLAEISPDQLQSSGASSNQKVFCYLELTGSLMKPTIAFDIRAPKADETGQALLASIRNDEDELNRQFFSLLLWKKFQPLRGSTSARGSDAFDLVSNQINAILSQVSKDYKLNVNLDADNITGENTLGFGVSKGFLDDRLIFTGSFGVESGSSTSQSSSALVGDVSLDYILNESGTFRITVFNESNDYSIIQDNKGGLFTQGIGLHYREDYDNIENFKLIQTFLDIFRKKENKKYPVRRKKRQTKVPPIEDDTKWMVLPENKLKKS